MSSHLDAEGKAFMVDVTGKADSDRVAVAEGVIRVAPAVVAAIRENSVKKGDALAAARIAGIMAAKNTSRVIPLCHDVPVGSCAIDFVVDEAAIRATATVKCRAGTGVEMEALHAVSVALLTIYDMCKAIGKSMEIGAIRLLRKSGGKSGDYDRDDSKK